jgi:hypothetical protein
MSRLPHFLDNRLTNGGGVVSPMHWLLFTPRKSPHTHICQRLSQPSHSATRRIRSIEKSNDLLGNQNHDLLACSIVPQPIILLHAPQIQQATWCYNPGCHILHSQCSENLKSSLSYARSLYKFSGRGDIEKFCSFPSYSQ